MSVREAEGAGSAVRRVLRGAGIVAAVAFVALLAYGLTTRSTDTTIDESLARGQAVAPPPFSLPPLASGRPEGAAGAAWRRAAADGRVRLDELRGTPLVVNFWASWCDPCRAEARVLESAQRRLLAARAGTVLGATYDDAPPDSLRFVREFHLTYPNVRDVGTRLAHGYGTHSLPETFVIDRRGRIVAISRGQISARFLDDALREAGA
jgi:cytochrome c biogenesis protein CcmG/thiol:disulfide interchange protein DsbE